MRMKSSKGIKVALGLAVFGYVAYDLLQEVAWNFFTLSNHIVIYSGLALLLGAPLLGIILLVNRAGAAGPENTKYVFPGTLVLAVVTTAFTTFLAYAIWTVAQISIGMPLQKTIYAMEVLFLYGIGTGLWWQAWILRRPYMPFSKPGSALAIVLFASLALNVSQWRDNYWKGRLPSLMDKMIPFERIEVTYPVRGFTSEDIAGIHQALDSSGLLKSNEGILSIHALDDDYAIVTTGFSKDHLWGGGSILGFIRTAQGWMLDEYTRNAGWVS